MAKIILTKGGRTLRESRLEKERITIGRSAYNDLVIEDIAISGEHAVVHVDRSEAVLEDLNSTNGALVNGQPIKKHFLQDRDVIELTGYRLRYVVDDGFGDRYPCSATEFATTGVSFKPIRSPVQPELG
jgi:pSer/pThr/pTyr-binding forkhead associated (FHA) protein